MAEDIQEAWVGEVSERHDAEILQLPIDEVHTVIAFHLTAHRTTWNDTRSHLYRGVDSLFEDIEDAQIAIGRQRKNGTYFKICAKPALKILAEDNYLIVTQINTSRPFYGWSVPERWLKLGRSLTLSDAYKSVLPRGELGDRDYFSGWPERGNDPDLIIGKARALNTNLNINYPNECLMERYSSKGVKPGDEYDWFRYVIEEEHAEFNTEYFVDAAKGINEVVGKLNRA